MNEEIFIQENICKSITGKEDENGNYIFEVEASNENIDLQNQITLQSALLKSKEYFLSNGVISDDHQHKTRNPDGSVETHKDKIIGEPISIRTDGKSTFVKGILYKGVDAAKEYINLLKNGSTRVKASIGGIMPKVRKNRDGTETVTAFMWNDLALTCSPVNWTVGSAKFAKSIGLVDFCKSLNAGYGTDAAEFTGGRALQREDIEKELLTSLEEGGITNIEEIKKFIAEKCIDDKEGEEILLNVTKNGGKRMARFKETMKSLLKSITEEDKDEKDKKSLFDDLEDEEVDIDEDENDDDETVEKGGDFVDVTQIMDSMGDSITNLEDENAELRKSINLLKEENEFLKDELNEAKEAIIDVAKSMNEIMKTPQRTNTVVQKSLENNLIGEKEGLIKINATREDLDTLKIALTKSFKDREVSGMTLEKSQKISSVFQEAMKGKPIQKALWTEICSLVEKYK